MILINKLTGILILIKLSNAQLINEVINKTFDTMERVHNTLRYENFLKIYLVYFKISLYSI